MATTDDIGRSPAVVESRGEHLADVVVHVAGILLGLVAGAVLLALALPGAGQHHGASLLVYALGLLAMLGASALYNTAPEGPRKEALRRLDHASIFVMIAGTYTPFAVIGIGGVWGTGLLLFVWTVAAAGVAQKLLGPEGTRVLSVAIYLLLGWSGLVAIGPLIEALPRPALILLGAGGLLYTIGTLVYVADHLPYNRAIWHLFVLVAAGCHYAAVLGIALPAAA